jgi:hypothetical protein
MTPFITDDQRGALAAGAGNPVPVLDQQTNETFFLVSANQFKTIEALLEMGEFHPSEMYPQMEQAAWEAGWNDPALDIYNDYDAHRR